MLTSAPFSMSNSATVSNSNVIYTQCFQMFIFNERIAKMWSRIPFSMDMSNAVSFSLLMALILAIFSISRSTVTSSPTELNHFKLYIGIVKSQYKPKISTNSELSSEMQRAMCRRKRAFEVGLCHFKWKMCRKSFDSTVFRHINGN